MILCQRNPVNIRLALTSQPCIFHYHLVSHYHLLCPHPSPSLLLTLHYLLPPRCGFYLVTIWSLLAKLLIFLIFGLICFHLSVSLSLTSGITLAFLLWSSFPVPNHSLKLSTNFFSMSSLFYPLPRSSHNPLFYPQPSTPTCTST